ncbi:hypothetical protein M0812_01966 [Anaeramoeba flamelloides]|uniref:Uncharacterized protein n=1 Tax=Anaeramoeba flamelloides TaxID=1746091 RepID=A0AAV7Z1K1_9EUKA|nr:hypothetical protein M0812_01966 [Anaeramoeba flamelloides]
MTKVEKDKKHYLEKTEKIFILSDDDCMNFHYEKNWEEKMDQKSKELEQDLLNILEIIKEQKSKYNSDQNKEDLLGEKVLLRNDEIYRSRPKRAQTCPKMVYNINNHDKSFNEKSSKKVEYESKLATSICTKRRNYLHLLKINTGNNNLALEYSPLQIKRIRNRKVRSSTYVNQTKITDFKKQVFHSKNNSDNSFFQQKENLSKKKKITKFVKFKFLLVKKKRTKNCKM